MPIHRIPPDECPEFVGSRQPSRSRRALGVLLLSVSVASNASSSHSQTKSSVVSLRQGQMLYQVYATAEACAKQGFYFNPNEIGGIGDAVNNSLSALELSEEERDQLWASVRRILQIVPPFPALCLDAKQWLALNVPDALSSSTQDKPLQTSIEVFPSMTSNQQPTSVGPRVGIFWSISRSGKSPILVIDATSLPEAEPYGEFLTHPRGHYGVWEKWRKLGPQGLKKVRLPPEISWHEYEHFPRGRIVFHVPTRTFLIYADRVLTTAKSVARIETLFSLAGTEFIVKTDEHYRTT